MTAPRDPDARIAAYFETVQPDLPDRTFDRIRRDIHGTRQRLVLGPLREPASLRGAAGFVIAMAATLTVAIVVLGLHPTIGPSGGPTPTPTSTASPSPAISPSAAASPAGPTTFTSPLYGYTVTVPAGWLPAAALMPWDGVTAPGPDADADRFAGPGQVIVVGYAGPFRGDLASFTANRIDATGRYHADTCPIAQPEVNEPLTIGGQPWILLGWNCGALINEAVTVHAGAAYSFTLRDTGIKTASDPADRALFLSILDTVEFPN